jgi:hypothetical protein
MGIHYTHWMHRLNINNNSAVWPEQQNLALRRWLYAQTPSFSRFSLSPDQAAYRLLGRRARFQEA